jgi:hypothetical protein
MFHLKTCSLFTLFTSFRGGTHTDTLLTLVMALAVFTVLIVLVEHYQARLNGSHGYCIIGSVNDGCLGCEDQ